MNVGAHFERYWRIEILVNVRDRPGALGRSSSSLGPIVSPSDLPFDVPPLSC